MPIMIIIMFATIITPVPLLDFAPFHSLCTPDKFGLVLISATMTLYTDLVVVNPFLHMLLADLGAGVLVAAVAGIVTVVVVHVAATAFCCVVPVEAEVLVVVEDRWGPTLLSVA